MDQVIVGAAAVGVVITTSIVLFVLYCVLQMRRHRQDGGTYHWVGEPIQRTPDPRRSPFKQPREGKK